MAPGVPARRRAPPRPLPRRRGRGLRRADRRRSSPGTATGSAPGRCTRCSTTSRRAASSRRASSSSPDVVAGATASPRMAVDRSPHAWRRSESCPTRCSAGERRPAARRPRDRRARVGPHRGDGLRRPARARRAPSIALRRAAGMAQRGRLRRRRRRDQPAPRSRLDAARDLLRLAGGRRPWRRRRRALVHLPGTRRDPLPRRALPVAPAAARRARRGQRRRRGGPGRRARRRARPPPLELGTGGCGEGRPRARWLAYVAAGAARGGDDRPLPRGRDRDLRHWSRWSRGGREARRRPAPRRCWASVASRRSLRVGWPRWRGSRSRSARCPTAVAS